jgi:hypothetical protein
MMATGTVRLAATMVCSALAGLTLLTPHTARAQDSLYPTGFLYRDVNGAVLPFQDHATILEVLGTAPIIHREVMERGVAKNVRLVLDADGTNIRAVLRLVDRKEREDTGSARMVVTFRDSYIFETAAYELDRMLGIGRIPPTTGRHVGGADGSVQIWMEGVTPEDILLDEDRLKPPDLEHWHQQKAIMRVFDALIANTDRNQGNLLIDRNWNIWFIDHTRAFRETSKLLGDDRLTRCERRLWAVLQETDPDAIRKLMEPYLTSREISKLVLRRKKLVKHFEKLIKKNGEEAVLFDLKEPELPEEPPDVDSEPSLSGLTNPRFHPRCWLPPPLTLARQEP